MRKITVLGLIVILSIILSSPGIVLASTQISLGSAYTIAYQNPTISGRYRGGVNRPQDRILEHSSGKICIISYGISASHLVISIYSPTGTLLSEEDIPLDISGGIFIKEYSSTEIIVFYAGYGASAFVMYFSVININTYIRTDYAASWAGEGGANSLDKVTQPYYYNGAWYIGALHTSYYNSDYGWLTWVKFIVSTHAVSTFGKIKYGHPGLTSEIMGFQDPDNLKYVYWIFPKSGSTTSEGDYLCPQFYVMDLSQSTPTFNVLATSGTSGFYPTQVSLSYDVPNANRLVYINGGVYENGTNKYLYHTWAYSQSPTTSSPIIRNYSLMTWTGKFNNTITAGTLLEQSMKRQNLIDASLSTYSTPGFIWGYATSTTEPELSYNVIYSSFWLESYQELAVCMIDDIQDMTSSYDSVEVGSMVDNLYVDYVDSNDLMYKNPSYTWSYHEVGGTASYLVINESVLIVSMSESFSYSPNDIPLITGKAYTCTWIIYRNGVIDTNNDTYIVRVDGIVYGAGSGYVSSSTGKATIPITVGTPGTHTLQITIREGLAEIYQGDIHSLTWDEEDTTITNPNAGANISSGYIALFTIWMPILGIVLLPMVGLGILGARFAGGLGFIIGMLSGGLVGTLGGVITLIIPVYALLLYLLMMGVALIITFKSGGSGG